MMCAKLILRAGRFNVERSYPHLIPVGLVSRLGSQHLEEDYIYIRLTGPDSILTELIFWTEQMFPSNGCEVDPHEPAGYRIHSGRWRSENPQVLSSCQGG